MFTPRCIRFTPRCIRALKRQYPTYSVDEIEAALILCMLSKETSYIDCQNNT